MTQEEIKRLEADIEAMDKIDYDTISERRNQLRQTKADKEKRLQAYNDYNEQLDMYLWGITHFGTSWDYVLTDVKLV